ncbi:outer membrane protein [Melioribacter roseus P3M-2]|uniref:Outer membrane protein n=1 Tax=Melioribacter roseus (strain DSM 23840 / JCM 17771 / VKM B-2668 / P3M-2) TaxID=1191523 RepID=I7A0K2_MELRP|nr:hypothetical protein [Melioribacter roseus]AFN73486.1 outer membrane protein [Melioribacter roseus P3M-2]
MKKIIRLFVISLLILPGALLSQNNNWGVDFHGFVKTDFFYDTHEVITAREGHFLLYPSNDKYDVNGKIINDRGSFNILSIQTRLTGKITAPDVLGAKTGGIIEGAFFGHSEGDINGFRLRHAFVKLEWENTSLLAGQYWHPMFVTEVFPDVVSFNTGAPFQPFSRNPQLRITQKVGISRFIFAAYSQRDFASPGPEGSSSIYLRNSGIPGLHFQASFNIDNLLLGAGIDYKSLLPEKASENNFYSDNKVQSFSAVAFGKLTSGDFTAKLEGVYGQNLFDLLMLGGYAVNETDINSGVKNFTNLNIYSVWTDLSYGKDVQIGLFAGYTQNNGAENNVTAYYSRGSNIDYVYRISPRVVFNSGKLRIAGEVEYTVAAYGTTGSEGKVYDSKEIANLRVLTGIYLFF